MRPAGDRDTRDQGAGVVGRQELEIRFTRFAFATVDEHSALVPVEGEQGQAAGPALLARSAGNDSQIHLGNAIVREEATDRVDRAFASRHDEHAARGFVESMHVADETYSATAGPVVAIDG